MSTPVTGHTAPVPRKPSIARLLGRDHRRIRRLEVNRTPWPPAGFATYGWDVSGLQPADTWAPAAPPGGNQDNIGLWVGDNGLYVPNGWMFWANVRVWLDTAAAPVAGDFLQWGVLNDGDVGDMRTDLLVDSSGVKPAQQFGAGCIGSSLGGGAVLLQPLTTALGTLFTPQAVVMLVTAIKLPAGGYASGPPV